MFYTVKSVVSGPGNGSPITTNVVRVLVLLVRVVVVVTFAIC